MYIYIYIYICLHVYLYLFICLYSYIHMHTHFEYIGLLVDHHVFAAKYLAWKSSIDLRRFGQTCNAVCFRNIASLALEASSP